MTLKTFAKIPSGDRVLDLIQDQLGKLVNTQSALLNGALTFGSNFNAELLTVSITTPTSTTGAFANGYPYAEYYASAVQNITNNSMTVVNFDSKTTDTDNAVTTGSGWKFTVPTGKDGTYQISSSVSININNAGFGLSTVLKNGAEYKRGNRMPFAASTTYSLVNSIPLKLVAGDTISVGAYHVTGATQALDPSSTINVWCSIQALNLTTPPVLSCFPLLLSPKKVFKPVGALVVGATDMSTTPTVPALGLPTLTTNAQGQLYLTNLPGLLLGRAYSVSLLLVGG